MAAAIIPQATKQLYLYDTYLFTATAKVLQVVQKAAAPSGPAAGSKASSIVILDQTIFYAQGGGQPSDEGEMVCEATGVKFKVSMVKADLSHGGDTVIINHEGSFEGEGGDGGAVFSTGDVVSLKINSDLRIKNSQCHSLGHLFDHALYLLKYPVKATKAYHFLVGPYVDYELATRPEGGADGNAAAPMDTSPAGLDEMKKRLEAKAREMVAEELPIKTMFVRPGDLSASALADMPEKLRERSEVRLIQFADIPEPTMCGGTHLSNTKEIGAFNIKKVSFTKGIIRVAYRMLESPAA